MHFFRRTLVSFLHSLFAISLISFGLLLGVRMVFATPDVLKDSLKESGIYEVAAKELLSKNTQAVGSASADGLPTTDPKVQAAIEKTFPPSTLEQNANEALDSTFNWLKGTTESLQFNLDLSASQNNLSTELTAYAQTRLATLPACPVGTPVASIDPLKATCRPQNLDADEIAAKVRDTVTSQQALSDEGMLTQDSAFDNQGQTIAEQLQAAPKAYQWSMWSFYFTGIIGVLAGITSVLLHYSRRRGLQDVSITCITTALTLGVIAFLSSYLVQRIASQFTDAASEQQMQAKITQLIQLLLGELRVWLVGYAVAVGVVGIILLITLRLTKPKPLPPADSQQVPPAASNPLPPTAPTNQM